MITKFETAGSVAGSSGKGNNTLLYIIIGAVGLYLAYKYIIKPDKDKEDKNKSQ